MQIAEERKKRVIDLYFNQNKSYAEIAETRNEFAIFVLCQSISKKGTGFLLTSIVAMLLEQHLAAAAY
jgi:hypothetical protein